LPHLSVLSIFLQSDCYYLITKFHFFPLICSGISPNWKSKQIDFFPIRTPTFASLLNFFIINVLRYGYEWLLHESKTYSTYISLRQEIFIYVGNFFYWWHWHSHITKHKIKKKLSYIVERGEGLNFKKNERILFTWWNDKVLKSVKR
jgi:hypothetical protein